MSIKRRSLIVLCAICCGLSLLCFAGIGTAFAHAKVDSATPGIGATVSTAPTTVMVHTVENVLPGAKKSNLFVYGPHGNLISQGDATIPLNNPQQMSVKIKPDGDGVYIVRWITVSADDNDPAEGAFSFTVKSGAGSSATASSPTKPMPGNSSNGGSVNQGATSTASNGNNVILPAAITGILALLVGLGAGFALGRNRTHH